MLGSKEAFAIKLSVYGSVLMAVTGVLASIYGNSISLLFDALYTVVAMFISIAGLRIAKLLKIKYSPRFNFGYYSFEPLFVLVNGLLLITLAVTLFISSIQSILNGGREIELAIVTEYLLFSVVVCSSLTVALKFYAKKTKSEILHSESINWMLDTLISVIVLIVFALSYILEHTSFNYLIPYLDPGITIVLILSFVNQPIKLLKSSLFDLLQAAPPQSFINEVSKELQSQKEMYGFDSASIRASKIGRTRFVEICFSFPSKFEFKTIDAIDNFQTSIKSEIEKTFENVEVKILIKKTIS